MTDGNGQALAVRGQGGEQRPAESTYSREQIDTIKKTVAKGASDSDLALFLEICRSRSLDPFTRQVHWTPKGIICGIDGFRAIADRTNRYAPGPTRYELDEKGGLVAAFVTIRKLVAGAWFDLEESAYLSEYRGTTPIWREKPRVMLAKCAEARALRRAFPADLSGLYAPEEMDDVRTVDVTPAKSEPARAQRPHGDVVEGHAVELPARPPAKASSEPIDQATGEVAVSFAVRAILEKLAGATTREELKNAAELITAAKSSGELTPDECDQILRPAYKVRMGEVRP